jgi:hypothetical protein
VCTAAQERRTLNTARAISSAFIPPDDKAARPSAKPRTDDTGDGRRADYEVGKWRTRILFGGVHLGIVR